MSLSLLGHLFLLHNYLIFTLPAAVDKCILAKSKLIFGSCQPFSDGGAECQCEEDFEVCKFSLSDVEGLVCGEKTGYRIKGGTGGAMEGEQGGEQEGEQKGAQGALWQKGVDFGTSFTYY